MANITVIGGVFIWMKSAAIIMRMAMLLSNVASAQQKPTLRYG